jgi:formylglycine-generating enzyme required for sulfatase activity
MIGGVAATAVTVVSATSVTAVTPPQVAGVKSVSVTTAEGTATLASAFTAFNVPSWATVVEGLPNPTVVTNATLRAAITASGFAWRVRDTSTNIEMLLVPPGSFNMGCSASFEWPCNSAENPVHAVQLTNAFYMGRYEVTQAQWTARMGSNPSEYQGASAQVPAAQVPNRPVERVSWNAIQSFLSSTSLRLPTEAEWEYAYRAGTTTAYHSMPGFPNGTNDDSRLSTIAWFEFNSAEQTRPVGLKAANGFGLHDMSGNVAEWVNDWYSATYYASSPAANPPGPASGTNRVLRGGFWFFYGFNQLRSSARAIALPTDSSSFWGFRVARTATVAAPTLGSVAPSSGPTSGGTAITLTGSNLLGVTSVTVGGSAATSVAVLNSTTVTAVTPPGVAGARDVSVTTSFGTATLPSAFTYVAPWFAVLEQDPDPTVVTDTALRSAIIATGLPWRVRDTTTQIEMLLVPPGTFSMGCSASSQDPCSSDETPVRAVTLTQAFYIGRYEVTQTEWRNRVGSNPSYFQGANYPDAANRPVEQVSWNSAKAFVDAAGLRLPTEAEWEYAYRAGTSTAFHGWPIALNAEAAPNGTNDGNRISVFGWFVGNNGEAASPGFGTKVVGQLAGNGLGLHDMAGNVAEYTDDWLGTYPSGPATNPTGPSTGFSRVFRGGSWFDKGRD